MALSLRSHVVFLCACALAGCGGAPRVRPATDADLRVLPEAQAIALVGQAVQEGGLQIEQGWSIHVGDGDPLPIDVRLAATDFGIEWVTESDRSVQGSRLPMPAPDGQLRILPGAGADASAQILVLDDRFYRYDTDDARIRAGAVSADEVSLRVRRDVRDFLEYMRAQGVL